MPNPETPGYVSNATGRVLSGISSRLDALVGSGGNPQQGAAEVREYMRPLTPAEQHSTLTKRGRAPSESKTVLRTETTRMLSTAKQEIARKNNYFVRYMIAPSHPRTDACDSIASEDFGYGPGVYLAGSGPTPPAHPNCRCYLVTVPPVVVERLSGGNVKAKDAARQALAYYSDNTRFGRMPTKQDLELLANLRREAGLDSGAIRGFPQRYQPRRLYTVESRGRGGTFEVRDITGVKIGDLVNYGDGNWLIKAVDGDEFLNGSQYDAISWARAKFWGTPKSNYKSLERAAFYTTADLRAAAKLPKTTMDFYLRAGIIQPSRRTAAGRLLYDREEADFLLDIVRRRDPSLSLRNFRDDFTYRREIMSDIELPSLRAPRRKHPRLNYDADGNITEVVRKKDKSIGNINDAPSWIRSKEDRAAWVRSGYWRGRRNPPQTVPNYRLALNELDPEGRTLNIIGSRGNVIGDVSQTTNGWTGLVHTKNQLVDGQSLDDIASFVARLDEVARPNTDLADYIRIPEIQLERIQRDRALGKAKSVRDLAKDLPERPPSAPKWRVGRTHVEMDPDYVGPRRVDVEIQDLDGDLISVATWTPESKWTAEIPETGITVTRRENLNDLAEYLTHATVSPETLSPDDLDFILAIRREAGILDPIPGFTRGAGENYPKYTLKHYDLFSYEVFDEPTNIRLGVLFSRGDGSYAAVSEKLWAHGAISPADAIKAGDYVKTYNLDDGFAALRTEFFSEQDFAGYDWWFNYNNPFDETYKIATKGPNEKTIGSVAWDGMTNKWIAYHENGTAALGFDRLEDAMQNVFDNQTAFKAQGRVSNVPNVTAVADPKNPDEYEIFDATLGNTSIGRVNMHFNGTDWENYNRNGAYSRGRFLDFDDAVQDLATRQHELADSKKYGAHWETGGDYDYTVEVTNRTLAYLKREADYTWRVEVNPAKHDYFQSAFVNGIPDYREAVDVVWTQSGGFLLNNGIPKGNVPKLPAPKAFSLEFGKAGQKSGSGVVEYVLKENGTDYPVAAVIRDGNEYIIGRYDVKSGTYFEELEWYKTSDDALQAIYATEKELHDILAQHRINQVKSTSPMHSSGGFNLHGTPNGNAYQVYDSSGTRVGNAEVVQSLTGGTQVNFYDVDGQFFRGFADEAELLDYLEQFNPPKFTGDWIYTPQQILTSERSSWRNVPLPRQTSVRTLPDETVVIDGFGSYRFDDIDGKWIATNLAGDQELLDHEVNAIRFVIGEDYSTSIANMKPSLVWKPDNTKKNITYYVKNANGDDVALAEIHPKTGNWKVLDLQQGTVKTYPGYTISDDISADLIEANKHGWGGRTIILPGQSSPLEFPRGTLGDYEVLPVSANRYELHWSDPHYGRVYVGEAYQDLDPATGTYRWFVEDSMSDEVFVQDELHRAIQQFADLASNEGVAARNRRSVIRAQSEDWRNILDGDERSAVYNYGTDDFTNTNGLLRSVLPGAKRRSGGTGYGIQEADQFIARGKNVIQDIAALDSALQKGDNIPDTYHFWRSTGSASIAPRNNPKVGEIFLDPGFFSTTIAAPSELPAPMGRPINLNIIVPNDGPGRFIPPVSQNWGEQEFLMPRNTVMRVVDVDNSWGQAGLTTLEVIDVAPTTDKRFRNWYEHLIEDAADKHPGWLKQASGRSRVYTEIDEQTIAAMRAGGFDPLEFPRGVSPTRSSSVAEINRDIKRNVKIIQQETRPLTRKVNARVERSGVPTPTKATRKIDKWKAQIIDKITPQWVKDTRKRIKDIRYKLDAPKRARIAVKKKLTTLTPSYQRAKIRRAIVRKRDAYIQAHRPLRYARNVWRAGVRTVDVTRRTYRTARAAGNILWDVGLLTGKGIDKSVEVGGEVSRLIRSINEPSLNIKPYLEPRKDRLPPSPLVLNNSKDFREARKNLEDMGVEVSSWRMPFLGRFGFKKDLDEARTLDIIAASIQYQKDRGLPYPRRVYLHDVGNASAYFDTVDRGIHLDPSANVWKSNKVTGMLYRTGQNTAARPEGIILHEIAHLAWSNRLPSDYYLTAGWDRFFGKDGGPRAKFIANEVSSYATQNPGEFIAETYAKTFIMGTDEWMSPTVRYLYDELEGPALPFRTPPG